MRIKMSFVCLLFVTMFFVFFPGFVQASSPQETLNQYITDLQKSPDDQALREKIIKFAQVMKPSPKVPNEVDELIGKATYIFKNAKSEAEFNDAVDAYQKALLIAPWVPEYYYNLGTVQEKAGKFKEAVESLELYLLAAPEAKDAKEVREHIGGLKYAAEKAMKPSSETVTAQEQNKSEDLFKKIDGRRYTLPEGGGQTSVIDVKGKVLVWGNIMPSGEYSEAFRSELQGLKSPVPFDSNSPAVRLGLMESTLTVSEDGANMTNRMRYSNGDVQEHIYLWQK